MNTLNLKSIKIMDLLLYFQIYLTHGRIIHIKKNKGLMSDISPL